MSSNLVATDHAFLLLNALGVPLRLPIDVDLHEQMGAPGMGTIGHQHRVTAGGARGILGSVNEVDQVAAVEVLEALDVVDQLGDRRKPRRGTWQLGC